MKAFLMYRDRDVDPKQSLPPNAQALAQDLGLDAPFAVMANGDRFILEIAEAAVMNGVRDVETIVYRQHVLDDCLKNAAVVRDIYALATEAVAAERRNFWGVGSRYPSSILRRSIEVVEMFLETLARLKSTTQQRADGFASEGFCRLFAMLQAEIDDAYLARAKDHLERARFRWGILMSTELGEGNRGTGYVLREAIGSRAGWFARLFPPLEPGHTFRLHPRDESGARALSELADRGINLVADALAQSADHLLAFFSMLKSELAFYVGCINLHERLTAKGEPVCVPVPMASGTGARHFTALYDVALALSLQQRAIGNDVDGDGKALIVVTGANQGGKSTFLRSIGLSQLMMQCGMFVPATSFCASLCEGVFTHYKREEDDTMESGKFDEELRRISELADHLTPNALVLFNESFSATNEREGSEIARQIVTALVASGVNVVFVTHLYDFAHGLWERRVASDLFLRAQRRPDGERTLKVVQGEPLATSFGEDIYGRVFGTSAKRG